MTENNDTAHIRLTPNINMHQHYTDEATEPCTVTELWDNAHNGLINKISLMRGFVLNDLPELTLRDKIRIRIQTMRERTRNAWRVLIGDVEVEDYDR